MKGINPAALQVLGAHLQHMSGPLLHLSGSLIGESDAHNVPRPYPIGQ